MECQAKGVFILPKITNQVKRKTQTQTIGIKYLFFTYETRNMMQPIVSQNSNMRSISTVLPAERNKDEVSVWLLFVFSSPACDQIFFGAMPTKGRKIARASESYGFRWDCIDWRQSLCYFPFCKSESFEILMLGSEQRWNKSLYHRRTNLFK